MAGLKRAAKIIAAGAVLDIGLLLYVVRACEVHPVTPSDPIFRSPSYRLLNPHHNPATQDEVVRRMPLAQVRDELLTPDGHLVEAFCGSVFGGTVYAVQRWILERKYRSADTARQLWDRQAIKDSSFPVGTIVTDHFEVVERTPDTVTLRCGDSPKIQDVRPSDGLFQVSARVDRETGEVVLGLKSVFFQGLGRSEAPPMPVWIQCLHVTYALWMLENGARHLKKVNTSF